MGIDLVLLIILLILSGFFSGTEIALFSLSESKVDALAQKKIRNADLLVRVKARPQRLLSTILIGNNVVNIGASAYATVIATEAFGSSGAGIAVGVMTLLVLVFGEITPKAIATKKNQEVSLAVAPVMLILMWLLHPVVWLLELLTNRILKLVKADALPQITEDEIRAMIGKGEEHGTVESDERELLEKVFEFGDLTAEDAMTVYKDIFAVDGSKKLIDVLRRLIRSPYSRIPVYINDRNNIMGVLQLREVMKYIGDGFQGGKLDKDIAVKDLASKPYFIPDTKPIDEVLKEFKKRHRHIAVVVNEYGDTVGIITMEDILEQLVGEIADETDVDEFVIKRIDKHNILVDGDEEIGEINEFFNVNLEGPKNNSVSWLILQEIGHIPKKGDYLEIGEVGLTIVEASDRSIEKVKITKQEQIDEPKKS